MTNANIDKRLAWQDWPVELWAKSFHSAIQALEILETMAKSDLTPIAKMGTPALLSLGSRLMRLAVLVEAELQRRPNDSNDLDENEEAMAAQRRALVTETLTLWLADPSGERIPDAAELTGLYL